MSASSEIIIDRIFEIPEVNLGAFNKRMSDFHKTAKKLGLDLITVNRDPEVVVKPVTVLTSSFIDGRPTPVKESVNMRVHTFSVSGRIPKINGWSFVASLDHVDGLSRPVINSFQSEPLPKKYMSDDCGPDCDHCQLKRSRNKTVVIHNQETQEYKQIGSTCISDFFPNSNAEGIIAAMQLIFKTIRDIDELEEFDQTRGVSDEYRLIGLQDVLAKAVHDINQNGFVPVSQESEGLVPTARIVESQYSKKPFYQIITNRDDEQYAEKIIEWLKSDNTKALASQNNYFANLVNFAEAGYVSLKHIATAISSVAAYQREIERLLDSESLPGGYIGAPGDKLVDYPVKLTRTVIIEDFVYNKIKHLMLFTDEHNNKISWMCSGARPSILEGDTVHLSGTITEHSLYKDKPQTKMTRCTVLEDKLFASIDKRDEKSFLNLLKRKPNVNALIAERYSDHTVAYSMLYRAISHGNEMNIFIDKLIAAGADVRLGGKDKETTAASALCYLNEAMSPAKLDLIKTLMKTDPDILSVSINRNGVPLIDTMSEDNLEMLDESCSLSRMT